MKNETFNGEVSQAYGKPLPTPVKFSGTFDAYESFDEAKTANDILSNEEMLNVINAKRKAAARAAATTAALEAAGISKPDPNSPEVVRANTIKLLVKQYNVSEAVAGQILDAAAQAAQAVAGQ